MAEKKKQHFVPKLLLRHFSNKIKKAKINIFNVETEFYRVNCPLDSQAQEDYFYGEDKVIEDALGKIEDSAAPIIAEIIKEKKFITSDNPCNRYNQYLEKRNHPGGHLGLFSKGLQLFFPISPDLMLLYYDKWAYKFGNKKDKEIILTDENDINHLNLLQLANCHKICIFDDSVSEMYLKNLTSKVNNLRQKDKSKLYKSGKRHLDIDGNERITYIHQTEDRKLNLKLSFVKEPQGAKSHNLTNHFVQLRNENMRDFKG